MSEQGFTVRLSARIDGYLAAMESAKRATKEVGDSGVNLDRLGGKMQDVGTTLSKSVTLPLIAVGGVAVKMAADYDSAFARMEGLAGVQAGEVDGLKKSVLDLAGETAQAPQKLADALYEASSAGLDTAGAMDAVAVAAKGAAVGMGSAQDIVGLVASATAAYGKENINAAQATDILTASIKAGRADPAELAGSLGRILPIASQLGVSFSEVGGATAFLSNIMGNTAETVTALQGFFVQLLSPTKQGQQALLDMGTSVQELHAAIDEKGLMGALDLLRSKGFGANQDALRNLFPDVQAFQGALSLISDTSGALTGTLDATANSTGALDTAFGLASDTAGFKMKQAWAEVQVALIQAGDVILPIVSGVAGAIGKLAEEFTGLPHPVQVAVIALLGLAAAAGPLLMIAGTMVKNYKEVKLAFAGLAGGASTAAVALGAVGLVMIAASAWYSDNAAKKAKLVGITNDFAKALEDEKAGQQGAVDAAVAKGLSDQKLIEQAKVLNLSVSDLAKIVRGEAVPAYEKFQQVAEDNGFTSGMLIQNAKTLGISTTELSKKNDDLRNAYSYVNGVLAPLNDGLANATDQMKSQAAVEKELAAAKTETARETSKLTGGIVEQVAAVEAVIPPLVLTEAQQKANTVATKEMAKELDRSTNVFEIMAGAASILKKALDEVFGGAQNLEDANRALLDAIDATNQSFKDNGKTLDINTEKGRANRQAVEDHANAILADGVALVGHGESQQVATDSINNNIVALQNQLIAAGLTKDEVDAYIATLGLTPENVNTAITLADTEATKLRIKDLQDRLGDIDAGAAALITADIDQGKFDEAESKLLWVARTRDIELNLVAGSGLHLIFAAGTDPLLRFAGPTAGGGFFDREQLRSISEGGAPEAVMPLDNPGRMQALMSDPRIGGPIAAAQSSSPSSAPPISTVTTFSATVENYHQPVTVDVISRALAMARLD